MMSTARVAPGRFPVDRARTASSHESISNPPSELCVLADPYLLASDVRAIEYAVEETEISVPLVIVNDPENPDIEPEAEANAVNNRLGLDTARILYTVLKREQAWTLVYAERKLAESLGSTVDSLSRVHVDDVPCFSDSDIQYVTPKTEGSWAELPTETVDLVQKRCDVVVRFGFGLLRGNILGAPPFGVLSFHMADIRRYRGLGVPQAWADGAETMGVTLQRLNEDIDGGEIVAYGETDVSDCATLWQAFDAVNEIKAELLAKGISNLRDPTFQPRVPDSLGPYHSVKKRRNPSFAGRVLRRNIAGRLRQVAGK